MYNSSEIILVILIFLVIVIVLFFLLRELNCWYWKINERIRLQKEILFYLKKIVSPDNKIENTANVQSNSDFHDSFLNSLTKDEKTIIDDYRMKGLEIGDKIIMHKTLRNIIKVSAKEWKSYDNNQGDWVIIIE